MSISQDRILRLIHSGLSYRTAYESLCEYLKLAEAQGPENAPTTLRSAHALAIQSAPPREVAELLTLEAEHFRRHAKANDKARQREAQRRLLRGVTPRQSNATIVVQPRPEPTILAKPTPVPPPIPVFDEPIPEGVLYSIEEIEALTAKAAEAYDREQQEKRLALAQGAPSGVKLKL